MKKYFAGIGSRKTPTDILKLMESIAFKLGSIGYTLRSGGAEGADKAFENGADKGGYDKEIYTPENFDKSKENLEFCHKYLLPVIDPGRNFFKFRYKTKLLLCRNVHQILGEPDTQTAKQLTFDEDRCSISPLLDIVPVKFVVFWIPTENIWDLDAGGTKYAVRIASNLNIPCFNLFDTNTKNRLEKWLSK